MLSLLKKLCGDASKPPTLQAAPPQAPQAPALPDNALFPHYATGAATMQSTLDIFKSQWKSRLPEELGLSAGTEPMFEDPRVRIFGSENIPGGIAGKSILELGPFEAYNTYHFEQLGAREVISIEGNNINLLKCLILKQALGLKATFLYGDFCESLEAMDRRFDVIWASGVLYHQRDPLRFLELACNRTDTLFIWTHHYNETVLSNHNKPNFDETKNVVKSRNGFSCMHYYRSYLLPDERHNIPLHFGGGSSMYAYWLRHEDIVAFLDKCGMKNITYHKKFELDGLPVVSFLAQR